MQATWLRTSAVSAVAVRLAAQSLTDSVHCSVSGESLRAAAAAVPAETERARETPLRRSDSDSLRRGRLPPPRPVSQKLRGLTIHLVQTRPSSPATSCSLSVPVSLQRINALCTRPSCHHGSASPMETRLAGVTQRQTLSTPSRAMDSRDVTRKKRTKSNITLCFLGRQMHGVSRDLLPSSSCTLQLVDVIHWEGEAIVSRITPDVQRQSAELSV